MRFEAHVPDEIGEEAQFYAERVTIDEGGIDLYHMGETISASFQGQDVVDISLAILHEDFHHLEERAGHVLKLGSLDFESLEDLGYIYLRAGQLKRQAEEAAKVKSVELVA